MAKMNVLQALNAAMAWEMEHDPDVILLGEDVGVAGGIFRVTRGLQNRFGQDRVIDTPLDEKGIAAHAIGLAMAGMKPVAEIQFSGFIHDAHEQIMFCGAKMRWMTGGEYSAPMVIRAPSYGGIMGGFWHSQSIESYYIHGGGIKIVTPSTPGDAYGLMLAAIRDPDPVLMIEPVPLYRAAPEEVEDNGEALPIGPGEKVREGTDVSVVTYGPLRHDILKVAEELSLEGIEVELLDLKTLVPYDIDLIVASVNSTGRLMIVHEASETLGFGAELAAQVQKRCFGYLEAPIDRICAPDLPYSYRVGDQFFKPNPARIRAGIRRIMEFSF
ncbi:MAG TPA: alpha-ketoacid dehydrogenase subunit beta [Xanthomonadales bacterium]|nr:alpha-ketoacid dehydrogenase subunit beta [Xanthomonadales bacterium]